MFPRQQDSILGVLYTTLAGTNGPLSVVQKGKKVSIISISCKTGNELFSKVFTETVAKVVSDFYVETKNKKAKLNYAILQKQTDSIRNELDRAITGMAVAIDNRTGLNKTSSTKISKFIVPPIDLRLCTASMQT